MSNGAHAPARVFPAANGGTTLTRAGVPVTLPVMESIHATCIAVDGHGVLLRGPSGSGKSDLALRLIDGGATLVGDDYCSYALRDGMVVVCPQATIAGLLEVRGVGILRLAHAAEAVLRLVVDLFPGRRPERLPEPENTPILGIPVRRLALDPFEASAAAKVRLAVRLASGDIIAAS